MGRGKCSLVLPSPAFAGEGRVRVSRPDTIFFEAGLTITCAGVVLKIQLKLKKRLEPFV
jgi:hypothetical protein